MDSTIRAKTNVSSWKSFCEVVFAVLFFFFFQAEDGIRDYKVTGVQTCALPILDVRMPGVDGIDATREIVREHARSRVLILTTFDLDEYAFSGLRVGASGFLDRKSVV